MDKHDRKLAILVHKNPDNDALGSALLVKHWYIEEKGYRPENIVISGKIDFARVYSDLLAGEELHNQLDDTWTDYEAVVVDTQTPFFLEKAQKDVLKGANKVTIYDHHISNGESFRPYTKKNVIIHYYANASSESCCEYIYHLMNKSTRKKLPVGALNGCLMGMYHDSNGFIHSTQETMKTVQELITLGGSAKCITHYAHRDIGIWGKLKYLATLPHSIMWMKDSKIAIIKTSFSDYSKCNYSISKEPANNRAPLYLLSFLNRERLKYCKTIHAYLLVYDREWVNTTKRYVMVLDLIKWSPKRQQALQKLGFPVFKIKQTRYYFSACQAKYFDMCKKVDKALIETHGDDLEDLYESK